MAGTRSKPTTATSVNGGTTFRIEDSEDRYLLSLNRHNLAHREEKIPGAQDGWHRSLQQFDRRDFQRIATAAKAAIIHRFSDAFPSKKPSPLESIQSARGAKLNRTDLPAPGGDSQGVPKP